MILVDTGPLVALFDPMDSAHQRCVRALKGIREPLRTTVPVLTEAFHMLGPASAASSALMTFVSRGGMSPWFLDSTLLGRAFALMEVYRDHPMDLADASLVIAAESLGTRKVFTINRNDFQSYRVRRGHRHVAFHVIP